MNNFNQAQLKAIATNSSRVLVLAGAGTGKTSVIVNRIVFLIKNGILPSKIIATTFTNKAAKELQERLFKEIGNQAYEIYSGTFHKISTQILRKYSNFVGLDPNFHVLTEDDQKRLVKGILKDLGKDEKVKILLEKISKYKETGKKNVNDVLFEQVFERYQKSLIENSFLDYSDLIEKAMFLFKNNSDIAKEICESVLVDEYQDINGLQYNWIKYLSFNAGLFCVGDEDQSIYAFRGADIKYIQNFMDDFKGAEIIYLEENYRSCAPILTRAVKLISKNNKKFKKNLIAVNEFEGFVQINKVYNEYDEAALIAKKIIDYKKSFPEYSIGILVRTNMQIAYIENALVENNIAYDIASGNKFYDKKEVKDLLCYFRAIASSNDFLAFSRIINIPKRGIGEVKLQLLLDTMKSLKCDFEIALSSLIDRLPGNSKEKCRLFLNLIQTFRKDKLVYSLRDLIDKILKDLNYLELEGIKDSKNIDILKDHVQRYASLEEFLANVQFIVDDSSLNSVQLMTIHGAKGLEFDIVFLSGWEENIFPSMLSKTAAEIEEERRLAYVAITRAKRYLEIFYAMSRKINGKYMNQMPSRFIFDL